MSRDECDHGLLRRSCETCQLQGDLDELRAAARKLFAAKGRHNTQLAMCALGELLGEPVVWPKPPPTPAKVAGDAAP